MMDIDDQKPTLPAHKLAPLLKVSNSVRIGSNHLLSTAVLKETTSTTLTPELPFSISIQLSKDSNIRRDVIEDKINQLKQMAKQRLLKCVNLKCLHEIDHAKELTISMNVLIDHGNLLAAITTALSDLVV